MGKGIKRENYDSPSLFSDMRIGRFSLCAVHPVFFFGGGGEGGCTQASLEDVFIICVKEISSVYVIVFKSSSLGYSFK